MTPSRSRALPVALATAVAAGLGLGAAALVGRTASEAEPGQSTAGATSTPRPEATATPTATATPSPTAPADGATARTDAPRIAFLGDSLTVGVGAPPERGYAWQTADLLGWPIALVEGVSGSGFLASGLGRPMPDRVDAVVDADPDVVVVAGGTNDAFRGYPPAEVGEAAAGLLADLRAGVPDATVVVVGPFPTTLEAATSADPTSDAVRAASEAAGAEYVDARDLVLAAVDGPAEWGEYISADGLHPNELGYGVMADALATELRALVD